MLGGSGPSPNSGPNQIDVPPGTPVDTMTTGNGTVNQQDLGPNGTWTPSSNPSGPIQAQPNPGTTRTVETPHNPIVPGYKIVLPPEEVDAPDSPLGIPAITIITQPASQTVTSGQSATFTSSANGLPPLVAHWDVSADGGEHYNPVTGPGTATTQADCSGDGSTNQTCTSTLTIDSVDASLSGNIYRVVFTNTTDEAVSEPATLTDPPSSESSESPNSKGSSASPSVVPAATPAGSDPSGSYPNDQKVGLLEFRHLQSK